MSYLKSTLARLTRDRRGVSALILGLTLALLAGFAGLAVDVAAWLNASRGVQAAADEAAYSAAVAAGLNGCAAATAQTQAIAIAGARGYVNGQNGVTFNYSCSNAVIKVAISQLQPMWFTRLFLASPPSVAASASAHLAGKPSDICVLALDGFDMSTNQAGTDSNAVWTSGSASPTLNCGVGIDSSDTVALQVGGASSSMVTDAFIVGNEPNSNIPYCATGSNGNGCLVTSPTPNSININQIPILDPYWNRVIPTLTSCTYGSVSNPGTSVSNATTLNPGVYCGGLTIGSQGNPHVTLNNGIYYIVGGNLTMNKGTVSQQTNPNSNDPYFADGVTFVLTGNTLGFTGQSSYGTLSLGGNLNLSLSAPTTGPFAGIAFFGDRNLAHGSFGNHLSCGNGNAQEQITGGSTMLVNGAIYFPNQTVCFSGGASVAAGQGPGACTQLIAYEISFVGNSQMQLNCTGVAVTQVGITQPLLIQ